MLCALRRSPSGKPYHRAPICVCKQCTERDLFLDVLRFKDLTNFKVYVMLTGFCSRLGSF